MFTWTRSLKQWLLRTKVCTTIRNRKKTNRARTYRPLAEQLECRLALATFATYDGLSTLTFTSTDPTVTVSLLEDVGTNQVRFSATGLVDPTIADDPNFDPAGGGEFVTTASGSINFVVVNSGAGTTTLEIGEDWNFGIPVTFDGDANTEILDLSLAAPQAINALALGAASGFDGDNSNNLSFSDLDEVIFGSDATDRLIVSLVSATALDVTYTVAGSGEGTIAVPALSRSLTFSGLDHVNASEVNLDVVDLLSNPNLGTLTVDSSGDDVTVSGADANSAGMMYFAFSNEDAADLSANTPSVNLTVEAGSGAVTVGTQSLTALALLNGGANYSLLDDVPLVGGLGNVPAQVSVTVVLGDALEDFIIANSGSYAVVPTGVVDGDGGGAGAQFDGLIFEYVPMNTPALTINAGTINLNSDLTLGSGPNAGDLILTATAINVNAASIDTTGGADAGVATFDGGVVLGADVEINSDGGGTDGNVTFNAAIDADDADANDRTLTVLAGDGVAQFNGSIGLAGALADLDVTAAAINLAGSPIDVNDDNSPSATVTFTGAVLLETDVVITTDKFVGDDNSVEFDTPVTTIDAALAQYLEILSGTGSVTFDGAIGASVGLTDLDVTAATINLNDAMVTVDQGTGNDVTFDGAVVLGTDVIITTTDNNALFTSTIDADDAINHDRTLTVISNDTVTFEGDIGAGVNGALANLDVSGGTINLNAPSVTVDDAGSGEAVFSGAVVLGASVTVDTDSNNAVFNGTIDGDATGDDRTLTVLADAANASFNDSIGTTDPLADLDVTALLIELNGAEILVNDSDSPAATVTFTGDVQLLTDVAITTEKPGDDNGVTFTGLVDGGFALVLAAGVGDLQFDGAVGGDPLISLTIDSAQNVSFNSSVNVTDTILQSAGTGTTTFSGAAVAAVAAIDITTRHITVTDSLGSLESTSDAVILTAAGNIDLQAFTSLTAAAAATMIFGGSATLSGLLTADTASADGAAGVSNTLTINFETAELTINSGGLVYNGGTGAGTDRLIANGSSGIDSYVRTGAALTHDADSDVNYLNLEHVTVNGGLDDDDFTFNNTSSMTTVVNGDGGNDTITLTGGSNITVNGGTGEDTFNVEVGSALSANLNGNDDADFFNLNASLTGTMDGGNGDDEFTLTATLTGQLLGNGGNDTIFVNNGGLVTTGLINGGIGFDTLDYTARTGPVTITISALAGTNDGFKGTGTGMAGTPPRFDNINNFVGDGSGTAITGLNVASTWLITGPNSGTYTSTTPARSFSFSGVTQLNGGTNVDTFKSDGLNIFAGTISGGSGMDLIDYSLNTVASVYTITALNAGNIDVTTTFIGVERLMAGSGDDTFVFASNTATLAGKIHGGGGSDTLDYGARTTGVQVDLAKGTATATGGILLVGTLPTVENVIGSIGHDVIFGSNGANILNGGTGGNDILSGIGGADTLTTANNLGGRSILIGGDGLDTLTSGDNSGGDIMIGGKTKTYDVNKTALTAILKEWTRILVYPSRVAHIRGTLGGGLNGSYKLTSSTVFVNPTADVINGGANPAVINWYIVAASTTVTNFRAGETKTII